MVYAALFSLLLILLSVYLIVRLKISNQRLQQRTQDLQEKINLINDDNDTELRHIAALKEKIERYKNLEKILEEINQTLSLEAIAESICRLAFLLLAEKKGSCLLYLADKKTHNLSLFKTKKDDPKSAIKAKEGDIFDSWVVRHNQALIVEDIKKDFRFDLKKIRIEEKRPVGSLISSPLISGHQFLGVLRLDNPESYFYNQDDLRLLATFCDLGAVALESGELFREVQDLAIHDELTGLYTKGHFLLLLKEECKRALRQNKVLSLLIMDIDYFKNYNDRFGHSAGDMVLKVLSRNITEFFKDSNPLIGRFGGEEFCVALPRIDKEDAFSLADKLRNEISKTQVSLRRQETSISVSIGVSGFPADARDEDELIFKADRAMYEAKQKGRNQVCGI